MTVATAGAAERYARAALEVAQKERDVEGWAADIARLEEAFSDPQVATVFENPRVDQGKRVGLALSLAPDGLKPERLNFLKLLVIGGRIGALPQVRTIFESLVAEAAGRVQVDVVVASDPSAADRERITSLISKRTGRETAIRFQVDPSILGGIVIRQGDHVNDGSVRRRLEELRTELVSQ